MSKQSDDRISMFYEKGNKMCKAVSLALRESWTLQWCCCFAGVPASLNFISFLMFPKIVSLRAN